MRLKTEELSVKDALDGTSKNFRELVLAIQSDLTVLANKANELNRKTDDTSAFLSRETAVFNAFVTSAFDDITGMTERDTSSSQQRIESFSSLKNLSLPDGLVWDNRYNTILPRHDKDPKIQLLKYPESFIKKHLSISAYHPDQPDIRYGDIHDYYPMIDGRSDTYTVFPSTLLATGAICLEISLPQNLVSNLMLNSIGIVLHPAGMFTINSITYLDATTGDEEILLEDTWSFFKSGRICFPTIAASIVRIFLSCNGFLSTVDGEPIVAGIQNLDLDMLYLTSREAPSFTYHLKSRQPGFGITAIDSVTLTDSLENEIACSFTTYTDSLLEQTFTSVSEEVYIKIYPAFNTVYPVEVSKVWIGYDQEAL